MIYAFDVAGPAKIFDPPSTPKDCKKSQTEVVDSICMQVNLTAKVICLV